MISVKSLPETQTNPVNRLCVKALHVDSFLDKESTIRFSLENICFAESALAEGPPISKFLVLIHLSKASECKERTHGRGAILLGKHTCVNISVRS